MYGDSIFESLLGNQLGQANADWADVAKVWTKYHGSSKSMVLAISGVSMSVAWPVISCDAEIPVFYTLFFRGVHVSPVSPESS